MDQLIVLGTGNATVTRCYNTCFAIRGEGGVLLCDAGGGNGILRQLELAGLRWQEIHHLILTHAHCDHLLGAVWVVRLVATQMLNGKYDGSLTIYCDPAVEEALTMMCRATLQGKQCAMLGDRIVFVSIADGQCQQAAGYPVTFFDIRSTKAKQFGFVLTLSDGRRLCCLGDEPYNPACRAYAEGAAWLLCEAFCLYADRERFKPYEKHHSTVKDACQLARSLGVPNTVLWHTEDKRIDQRKRLYTEEGRQSYHGNLYVPEDLETLTL